MTDPNRISDDQHNNAPAVPQGEPVAWRYQDARGHYRYVGHKPHRQNFAAEYAILNPVPLYATPAPAPAQEPETALQKFTRFKVAETEGNPVEMLRAFCAFAMNSQDWFDVEPFFDLVREAMASRTAVAPAQEPYTTIDLGHGKFEVGAGNTGGLPCIAFGRNGTGKVGEPITAEPRQMSVEETFAVITFANVTGLDVLQEQMDLVREEFFPGTTPQFFATQSTAPAQEVGLTDEEPAHVAGLLEQRRELDAIEFFESTNRDSYGFKKSVRDTYVNPAVARDWKWFQLGMKHATEDES